MISLKSLLTEGTVNEDIKKDIDKFIDKLNKQFPDQEYTVSSGGGKYVRINHKSRKFGGESAWGFIALVDNPSKGFQKGDLLKAAGYNTPAKNARGNILNGTAKYDKYSPAYLREETIDEEKKYKKGDKLKIKLKNGKKIDVVFDMYARTKGVALGKFKDSHGEYDIKPFDLDAIIESVNELKLNDLVGNQYKYVIGSGEEKYIGKNDKKYVLGMITKALETYLYDNNFALNYLEGSQRKEYDSFFKNEILKPMLAKIDFTLDNFFTLDKDKVKWNLSSNDTRKMMDEIFRKNSKIPADIKREYYDYRLDYAGVKLKESSKADIIKDLDKAKNDLLKKVDVLIAKKKKLYSNVDIESPMTADEKKLDKDIADLFSQLNQLVLQKRSLKESVNEAKSDYEVYHKSYTSAIEAARAYAEKKGYEINDDDAFTKIGVGPRKPSPGKTNRFSIELTKDGKPQRKMLHIQVYGMKNSYELNAYIQ